MKYFVLTFSMAFLSLASFDAKAYTLYFSTPFVGWQTMPITVDYNTSNCGKADISDAIDSAINLWNSVPTSSLKLQKGSVVSNVPADYNLGTLKHLTVMCDLAYSSNADVGSPLDSTVAVGVSKLSATSVINYGEVIVNGMSASTGYAQAVTGSFLQYAIAHALGTALGFGNSEKSYAVMYYLPSDGNLILSEDDVQVATYLYPRDEGQAGMFGCGSISSASGPSSLPPQALLLFLLPLMLTVALKYRLKYRRLTTRL